MLSHLTSLNKFQRTRYHSIIFSDHSGIKLEINNKKIAKAFRTWWSRRHHHGRQYPSQQILKGSTQGAQETGHLPTAVGQAILVSGQTNQLRLQPGDTEETVHELHQLALSR